MTDKIYVGWLGVTDYPQKLLIHPNQVEMFEREYGKEWIERNCVVSRPLPTKTPG